MLRLTKSKSWSLEAPPWSSPLLNSLEVICSIEFLKFSSLLSCAPNPLYLIRQKELIKSYPLIRLLEGRLGSRGDARLWYRW